MFSKQCKRLLFDCLFACAAGGGPSVYCLAQTVNVCANVCPCFIELYHILLVSCVFIYIHNHARSTSDWARSVGGACPGGPLLFLGLNRLERVENIRSIN